MELNLRKQAVTICQVLYDGTTEQPLECDVLLPDHCPDIQRILRCEVIPVLQSRAVSGERLTLDGVAMAQVYYLDEEGCPRRVEYKIPYTKTVELRETASAPSVRVRQGVDYFNCRSVGPRRLDMRGAVNMSVRVTANKEQEIISGGQGGGLQFRQEQGNHTVVLPRSIRPITIREELELGYGKPPIGNVLRCSAAAETTDFKAISGKLVAKAELSLRILYQCEEDPKQLELMEYTLPVNQVVDLEGVDEDCRCGLTYEVTGLDVQPKRNHDGESRAFTLEATLEACAEGYRSQTVEGCTDCYSTNFPCKPTLRPLPLLELRQMVNETCMYKETLDLPGGLRSIAELWCVPSGILVKPDNNGVEISGKLMVCMFAYDNDGQLFYHDQPRSFTHHIQTDTTGGTLLFDPQVRSWAAAFTLAGQEKAEVRCSLKSTGSLFWQRDKELIAQVALDETQPKQRQENLLYLYYANNQEAVWEIAKRYNTSAEAIRLGNQLEGEQLSGNTMLLIPMK